MKNVLLVAPILSRSGYGEHARLVYKALKKLDSVTVYVAAIEWGKSSWILEPEKEVGPHIMDDINRMSSPPPQFDLSIQVTIPNEWKKAAPVNIGITAGIETDRVDPHWLQQSALMDKIITISKHSKSVYEKTSYQIQNKQTGAISSLTCNTPIEIIGYPVKNTVPDEKVSSLDFSTKYNFLTVAQWGPRKNIANCIKWFVEEFKNDADVGLIIKTHQLNMSVLDRRKLQVMLAQMMQEYGDTRKCKIHLLHGDMTEAEIHALYTHPSVKCYITTTHGEGYGLPIFEAAYSGLPVIAPAWSGQNDFLYAPVENPKSKKVTMQPLFEKVKFTIGQVPKEVVWDKVVTQESQWCYPEEKSFKKKMREVYKNTNFRKIRAKGLQEYLIKEFSEDKIHQKYQDIFMSYLDTSETDDEIAKMFASLTSPE